MKIGYFADGPWSHKAIEKLVNLDDIEICFITPRYDTQDPILKEWAKKLNIPFLIHENVNSKEFIENIAAYNADLLVSMSFNQILRKEIISLPTKGFINCHAGALPFYRGRNPLNWVLINDEKDFGITVHMVDEGIDTGDIVLRELYNITDDDDYETLLNKAIFECANVLVKSIEGIRDKNVKLIKQTTIHPVGFYCGMRKEGDEVLTFNLTSRKIFNFVRAITIPGPGARVKHNGEYVAILKTEIIDDAPLYIGTPGEVVGRNSKGIIVKTQDSTILVSQMAHVGCDGNLMPPVVPRYLIGTRFL